MDCNEINQPEKLVYYFRQDNTAVSNQVFKCFYDQFFHYMEAFFRKYMFGKSAVTQSWENELTHEAFEEGLMQFHAYIRNNGFEQDSKATVRTFFTRFCKFRMLELIRKLTRGGNNPITFLKDEEEGTEPTKPFYDIIEEEESKKQQGDWRREAFNMLDQRCKDLLSWRKVDKLSNEEIAEQMETIKPGTVNSEVHKCFKRLLANYNNLKNKS